MRIFLSLLMTLMFMTLIAQVQDSLDMKVPPPPPLQSDGIFQKVEVEASIDTTAWRKHLQKKLLPYLEKATRKGMKPGVYTVDVRFVVDKNGSISQVKALSDSRVRTC
jgi:hypothetical protein